ncbi:MAG TPA: arabinan endo-1,5-alpha-L-arabinosidase [Pyrinomonadaceae bacterium]|nr:arabinan endo-1,5-alpha-L-arabinosidase [Pyrinomonadaceae bacterium]
MRGKNQLRLTAAAGCVFALLCIQAGGQKGTAPKAPEPTGDVRNVHDPTIIKEGGKYYIFSTRAGLAVRCSEDLVRWRLCGDVFGHLPGWAVEDVKGLRGLWAPDISYFNGKFHLYYSASTFGSNRSSIGLVTNRTLDPESDKYRWEDQGKVISSTAADDWNAIDPNIVLDEGGQPWLSFGSFWGGIKMRKLDPATGKLSAEDQTLYSLASRPRSKELPGAIEAPAILRKSGYYYLFVSFDFCCRGVNSTYNIRVGRSRKVTGPYVDRGGKPMMEDGGTPLLSGEGRWRGPGHCAILQERGTEYLVYHAYDAEARGIPTLRITPLDWDADGWPEIKKY